MRRVDARLALATLAESLVYEATLTVNNIDVATGECRELGIRLIVDNGIVRACSKDGRCVEFKLSEAIGSELCWAAAERLGIVQSEDSEDGWLTDDE